ncbi:MAG: hypothetical protein KBB52_07820, partial [Candidatus Omnitrophica bacterium]|nr:hypothetical protein [Candidatus Omnitrophota bacterium]
LYTMKYRLSHNQKMLQKMSLTSQMRLSVALLGMSASDISEYIENALSKNPFLKKLEDMRDSAKRRTPISPTLSSETYDRAASIQEKTDPRAALLSQANMMGLGENESPIVEYLIYELDPNGYLKIDALEAAADLGVDAEEVDRCIDLIQEMDPPGIGARNLKDCLQIQLRRSGKEKSLEYRIVDECLGEMATGDLKRIAILLKADEKDIKKAFDALKNLTPGLVQACYP